MRRKRGEEGTTLIELILASAISLIMLGSIVLTTTVIGGHASSLYHSAQAASNAEQLLDHAATQLSAAEQLGVCTQNPCTSPTTPFPQSPLLAASSSGMCFAAPVTEALAANTTPNSAPEALCIVTGGTSLNKLYLDVYPPSPSVTSYVLCVSLSECFVPSPSTCMGSLVQSSCSGSNISSYYLGVLISNTPFSYYSNFGQPITASGVFTSAQLQAIKAVQINVTVSAGYSTGHIARSYTLDYTAALH